MAKRGPTPAKPWGKWQPTNKMANRLTGVETDLDEHTTCWINNIYTVIARRLEQDNPDAPSMMWLSIRRNDRKPARDWRHLQRIKNDLVGAECEGVEIYPAESRLVDESNQTHLWVVMDPKFRWPWGYQERSVLAHDDPQIVEAGAVQRPFEEV